MSIIFGENPSKYKKILKLYLNINNEKKIERENELGDITNSEITNKVFYKVKIIQYWSIY